MARIKLSRSNCLHCGAVLDRRDKQYCTVRCQVARQHDHYIQLWQDGHVSGATSWATISRHVRAYLLETLGACSICGWAERNPVTGKVPLHIDHVDGDWRNNRPDNLRLLCPNHHALTATYGVLNRGKGRPFHVVKIAAS